MTTVFLFCAVIGGTVFLVQFVMALVGLGADDVDFMDDIPDDLDFDGGIHDHGSTWLFGVISFRTIVAALTFFGLAGLAAQQGGMPSIFSFVIAVSAGVAAMYGVHYLVRLMMRLRHDGTLHIERSVGARGTVYVPIPAAQKGTGKVQLKLQDRIVEYLAVTPDDGPLATGTQVEVVQVVNHNTVSVRPVTEFARASLSGEA